MEINKLQQCPFANPKGKIDDLDNRIIQAIIELLNTLRHISPTEKFEHPLLHNYDIIRQICHIIGGKRRGPMLVQFEQITIIDRLLTEMANRIKTIGQYTINNELPICDEPICDENMYQKSIRRRNNKENTETENKENTKTEQETLGSVFRAIHEWSRQIQEAMQYQQLGTAIQPPNPNPIAERSQKLKTAGVGVSCVVGNPTYIPEEDDIILSTRDLTAYPDLTQKKFRDDVMEYLKNMYGIDGLEHKNISFIPGSREGMFMVLDAVLPEQGGKILLPSPGYPGFHSPKMKTQGTQVSFHDITSCNDETWLASLMNEKNTNHHAVIFNFPSNPTGRSPSWDALEKALMRCKIHNITVIFDNAYAEVIYDEAKRHSIISWAQKNNYLNKVVELHSASKDFGQAGLRAGFVMGSEHIIKRLVAKINQGSGPSVADTIIYGKALKFATKERFKPMCEFYLKKQNTAKRFFCNILGCRLVGDHDPDGGFYLTVSVPPLTDDQKTLAYHFLEKMYPDGHSRPSWDACTPAQQRSYWLAGKYNIGVMPLYGMFPSEDTDEIKSLVRITYTDQDGMLQKMFVAANPIPHIGS